MTVPRASRREPRQRTISTTGNWIAAASAKGEPTRPEPGRCVAKQLHESCRARVARLRARLGTFVIGNGPRLLQVAERSDALTEEPEPGTVLVRRCAGLRPCRVFPVDRPRLALPSLRQT